MLFTPKLALTTTAVLVAVGLLWVGFVESGRSQATISQGTGIAAQTHSQLIAAEPMSVSHPKDNVPALTVSGSAIAALTMLALVVARFQTVHRSGQSEMATPYRPRLVTSGASQH